MSTLPGIRPAIFAIAPLSVLAMLVTQRSAKAEVISAVANLSTPSAAENTFDVAVAVLGSSDTQVITYKGVLRPVLDIDFSNVANPIVQSLDFAGVGGDIQHSDATFLVPLGTAVFTGVQGRIETLPGSVPATVVAGTTYDSGDHELIAWMGTIDITPAIGPSPVPQINLMNDTFRRSLGGANDSTVNLSLNNVNAGVATYDLELITPLQMVTLQTGNPAIDAAIAITITGNIVARTQITRPIPEPSTAALFVGAAMLSASGRRRLWPESKNF